MTTACTLLCLALSAGVDGVPIADLWTEFVEARQRGGASELPDFSYAGYKFSEQELPDVSARKKFDVTNYGAMPNDGQYDDSAIQAAVNAAEDAGGGVVFFPPGKFLIARDRDRDQRTRITSSHIVLKGSGAGPGGTEIFMNERRIGDRQFVFRARRQRSERLTTIIEDAPRESFWVEVADVSELSVGQTVILRHRSEAFTRRYFGSLVLAPEWDRLFGRRGGMEIQEIHTIAEIDGNRVRFANPIHFDLVNLPDESFRLDSYPTIVDCGVEDILFKGNWNSYPEEFVHHKDGIHDSGWCAIDMEAVEDSWIRNCEFRDWNECINVRGGYKVTIENVHFSGKKGHTAIHARSGYGVLVKNCRCDAGHHHGFGVGYGAVNSVITQCQLQPDQNIDSHSGQPFATLYDDIEGGVFTNLGGPHPGLPHHGRYMVFWNFRHRSGDDFHYNFWKVDERRNHTIAEPIFVGFRADRRITFENEGRNDHPGVQVQPKSLFEAQLALRLNRK